VRVPPLLRSVDAVTIPVPSLDAGLDFYQRVLGHELLWRHDRIGQAALGPRDGDTEIVLTTQPRYEPNWLVDSVDTAVAVFRGAGGDVLVEPFDIPVGRVVVVADPFANALVLVELTTGRYSTDDEGRVTGVESRDTAE
jgi:predicted enzyme related to lactoylglutathione lyase